MTPSRRRGVTLIELLVTVAVLGILSGVAAPALLRPVASDTTDPGFVAEQLRRDALRSGTSKSAVVVVDSISVELTAYPDGSLASDSALATDLLTGTASHVSKQ
jgi:prepilin-type N-terminal cleavage/methylation domain-containing protein